MKHFYVDRTSKNL